MTPWSPWGWEPSSRGRRMSMTEWMKRESTELVYPKVDESKRYIYECGNLWY